MRLSSTSSTVTGSWKCASGLRVPLAWFFTATWAISRSVMAPRVSSARVTIPARAGMVAPYLRS